MFLDAPIRFSSKGLNNIDKKTSEFGNKFNKITKLKKISIFDWTKKREEHNSKSIMINSKAPYKFIFEVIAAISILFSIIWSIEAQKYQTQTQKHQDEWQKKVETLHTLESMNRVHLKNINKKIKAILDKDSLLNFILSDTSLNNEITSQLIIFEDISIGSNIDVYDNEVIKKFMGKSFIKFNKKIQPYILYTRQANNNPNLYIEYDNCVKTLSEN